MKWLHHLHDCWFIVHVGHAPLLLSHCTMSMCNGTTGGPTKYFWPRAPQSLDPALPMTPKTAPSQNLGVVIPNPRNDAYVACNSDLLNEHI